jgi:hypothetical protein
MKIMFSHLAGGPATHRPRSHGFGPSLRSTPESIYLVPTIADVFASIDFRTNSPKPRAAFRLSITHSLPDLNKHTFSRGPCWPKNAMRWDAVLTCVGDARDELFWNELTDIMSIGAYECHFKKMCLKRGLFKQD